MSRRNRSRATPFVASTTGELQAVLAEAEVDPGRRARARRARRERRRQRTRRQRCGSGTPPTVGLRSTQVPTQALVIGAGAARASCAADWSCVGWSRIRWSSCSGSAPWLPIRRMPVGVLEPQPRRSPRLRPDSTATVTPGWTARAVSDSPRRRGVNHTAAGSSCKLRRACRGSRVRDEQTGRVHLPPTAEMVAQLVVRSIGETAPVINGGPCARSSLLDDPLQEGRRPRAQATPPSRPCASAASVPGLGR